MRITEETTVGELMKLIEESKEHLKDFLDDPIPSITICGDGSFSIDEGFYKLSATCNSSIDRNNDFTGHSVSLSMKNRLVS